MLTLFLLTALPQATYVLHASDRSTLDARQQVLLMRAIEAELKKYSGVRLVPRRETPTTECEAEPTSCFARLFAGTEADAVLTVTATHVADTDAVTLSAIALPSGEVQKTITKTATRPDSALDTVGELVQELLPSEPASAPVGVESAWRARWRPKPVPLAAFLAVGGVSFATLVSGAALGILALQANQSYQSYAAAGLPQANGTVTPISGAELIARGNRAQTFAVATNFVLVSGGVLAAAALIVGLFTDFGSDRVWKATASGALVQF
jgi:hypothetical protein